MSEDREHDRASCSVCVMLDRIKAADKPKLEEWVLDAEHDRDWQRFKRLEAEKLLALTEKVVESSVALADAWGGKRDGPFGIHFEARVKDWFDSLASLPGDGEGA